MEALSLIEIAFLSALLLSLGLTAGFLSGLLGVGGGIVLVPGLYYIFTSLGFPDEVLMHMAVGTSLAVIVPTGFSSARSHYKRGNVDLSLVKKIGIGILIGVGIGTYIADLVSGEELQGIFATCLLLMAAIMAFKPARFQIAKEIPPQPVPCLVSTLIGGLSTLMGIGGASLSVPFMTMCGQAIHRAVGTAAAIGLVISIPAVIGFMVIGREISGLPPFSLGYINGLGWLFITPVSVLTAPLGVRVAHKASVEKLRALFAFFLLIVATKMFWDIFSK